MAQDILYNFNLPQVSSQIYDTVNNYIYFYHTGILLNLPVYPENVNDQSQATFSSSTPLGRSAPIYSYSNSGPRSISFQFRLHRDLMKQINMNNNTLSDIRGSDDYVDILIKNIEACSVPKYTAASKMIDPPVCAIKIENSIFIKGVINGSVGIDWKLPMLRDGKYAYADISFTVSEITPYSAQELQQIGSYRDTGDTPLSSSLSNNFYTLGGSNRNGGGGSQNYIMTR